MDIGGFGREKTVYGWRGSRIYGSLRYHPHTWERRRTGQIITIGVLLGLVLLGMGYFGMDKLTGAAGKDSFAGTVEIVTEESGRDIKQQALSEQILTDDILEVEAIEDVNAEVKAPENILAIPDTDMVIIDPGHGGEDEGCERDGVLEKDINLQLALALREELVERGFVVILTRDTDIPLTLEERIELANNSGADIFVSIHQNAYEGEEADGAEVWYSSAASGKDSSRLASLLHKYLLQFAEAVDRGVVESDDLKVIRETEMPACLVETGFLSNAEERALLTDAEYQAKIVEGLAYGIEYYFRPKTMYLTFDDGPSGENTGAILDTLKEMNVKATFFVIGENVKKHPEVAKRIVAEGHTIGIHCYNHDYNELYGSVDGFLADFQAAYDIVYEVTGAEVEIFRFPGGSINAYNKQVYQAIIDEMTERGFIYYDWNAGLEDAVKNPAPEQLLKNAKESTLGRKKIIMLAHDTVHSTALCLEELLEQFPEYKMEPLTAEVAPIQF